MIHTHKVSTNKNLFDQPALLQKFLHHRSHVAMLSIHRIIQSPHIFIGNRSRQFAKRRSHLGMLLQHFPAHDRHRFVRRKVMMVVLQYNEVERRNQSIGIVAGNDIDLPFFECPRNQAEIHNARRFREAQAVAGDQTFVAIGTLHELIPKARPPLWRKRSGFGQRLKVQLARVLAADHHRKGVVKAKRRPDAETELCFIALLHVLIDILFVAARLLFKNCRQCRARIFRIDIDSSGEDCLVADECASQVETAFHRQMSTGFDDLREQFSEDELLGEVFRSNHDSICVSFTSNDRQEKQEDEKCADDFCRAAADRIDRQLMSISDVLSLCSNYDFERSDPSRRSSLPSTKSAKSASSAAGTAPAKITWLFTMASPRKINSPSPPAPIAAAIVANPMESTAAIRNPATMTPEASGNSTWKSNWRSVNPMARPASTTAGSTLRMPA